LVSEVKCIWRDIITLRPTSFQIKGSTILIIIKNDTSCTVFSIESQPPYQVRSEIQEPENFIHKTVGECVEGFRHVYGYHPPSHDVHVAVGYSLYYIDKYLLCIPVIVEALLSSAANTVNDTV
jgi:hypothetical protein